MKYVVPVVLATGTSVFGKSAIQNLTSKDKAEKVKDDVRKISKETRIPNNDRKHSLGIGIGQTFTAGDFDDTGEDKITWDLLYNYAASYSFDLLANFHHSKHEFAGRYTQLTSLNIGIKAKLYQIDNFSPFAVGGLGFYAPKVQRDLNGQLVESKTKVVFGYHFGAGGDLRLNDRVSVGLMGAYYNPFDVKQEGAPEVEGRYYKLLITAFYSF
jgi:opacity protein-like surface antigen